MENRTFLSARLSVLSRSVLSYCHLGVAGESTHSWDVDSQSVANILSYQLDIIYIFGRAPFGVNFTICGEPEPDSVGELLRRPRHLLLGLINDFAKLDGFSEGEVHEVKGFSHRFDL